MFRVGQKVVCIKDGEWDNGFRRIIGPELNEVVTIREIEDNELGCGLRFCEYELPKILCTDGRREPRFNSEYFRPLVEKSTDAGMAVLKRLLKPKRVDA